jgi:hypothetical protein
MLPVSPNLPTIPLVPDTLGMSVPFRDWLNKLVKWGRDSNKQLEQSLGDVNSTVNAADTVGQTLASGATLIINARIQPVAGTAAISKINAAPDFSGAATLIAIEAWTLTTGGNISRAVAPVVGQAVIVIYNPATKIWYPA